MKRSPLERKTPLKRTGFKRRRPDDDPRVETSNRIRPSKRERRRPSSRGVEFSAKVRQRVLDRSGGACEMGGPRCTGTIEQFHHRKMRSQGGKGTLSNCLGVCHRCHHMIHHAPQHCYICGEHHPRWVYEHGLLVPQGLEPYQREVLLEPLDIH